MKKIFIKMIIAFSLVVLSVSCSQKNLTNNQKGQNEIANSYENYDSGCCGSDEPVDNKQLNDKYDDFNVILNKAKGKTVNFYGWGGSELVNNWIDNELAPYAKKNYDIIVNRVPMNIDEILNLLITDKENNNQNGNIDLIWINGENFASAKEKNLLYGPFTQYLPNFKKYINSDDDEIKYDFATNIDGYESPYSKAQLVFMYDSNKISNPPKSAIELLEYCKEHQGRFTYEALPGFNGSAFVRNIIYETVGYEKLSKLDKNTTKDELKNIIEPAIDYLKQLNQYLWQEGKTFPATNEIVDSMFMDGVIDFSISYDPYHVAAMIENGQYKNSIKSFIFDNGTIGNTNYVAIGFNSKNKEAAMCLADAILSVDMQSSKMSPKIWGTIPVLDNNKLSENEKKIFNNVDIGIGTLPQDELLSKRKPELPAYLVTMIEEIWNEEVVSK